MIRKLFILSGVLFLFYAVSSCFWERPEIYFKFYIPEIKMYVTTFKRPGKFYILMSPIKNETLLSDTIDYIELKIGDYVNIIVDSLDNKNIMVRDYYVNRKPKIHGAKYAVNFVVDRTFCKRYFDENSRFKKGYAFISMSTDEYGISVGGKTVKKGNMWGD